MAAPDAQLRRDVRSHRRAGSDNRTVMGERTNGRRLNVLGWGTTAVVAVAATARVVTMVAG